MRPVVLQQANWAHSYGKLGSQGQQEKETSSVKCYSQVCLHHIWYHSGSVTTQTEGMDKPTVPLVVCGGDAGGARVTCHRVDDNRGRICGRFCKQPQHIGTDRQNAALLTHG